jgi:hypothetical protein
MANLAIAASVLLVVVGIVAVMVVRPAEARDVEPDWTWKVAPSDITNNRAMRDLYMEKLKDKVATIIEEQEAQRAAEEQAALEAAYSENYYEPTYYGTSYTPSSGIYYAEYSDAYNTDGPSHTMPGWYDGYLETYYNASSHYLANTWTLDSEGFYHDENGRYVVGVEISHADEMPYGTVVQTGRGEAAVYDYGIGAEVHDFATNW